MKRRIAVLACWIPAVIAALLLSAAPVRAEAYVEAYRSPFGAAFVPHTLDLSCAADPAVVFPGGTAQLTATATDTFGHGVGEYVWEAFEDLRAAQLGSLDGGRPADVVIQGDYAYCAAVGVLTVYDLSNPGAPQQVAAMEVVPEARALAASGGYIYVAGADGLDVVDTADPAAPVVVGRYRGPLWPGAIAASGSHVYVSFGPKWDIRVFDVTDPTSPQLVGSTSEFGPCYAGLVVSGDYLYATACDEIDTLDISNPEAPVVAATYSMPGSHKPITAAGAYLYTGGDALSIIDASDPLHLAQISSLPLPLESQTADVAVEGTSAYLASSAGVRVVDVSDPGAPVLLGRCDSPAGLTAVGVRGGYAYVAAPSGLAAISVADGSAPALAGSDEVWGGTGRAVINGHWAYVPAVDGLRVVDLAAPGGPAEVWRCAAWTPFSAATVSDGYLYAATSGPAGWGLVIFGLLDPSKPEPVGSWNSDLSSATYQLAAVAISNGYAYLASTCSGIEVLNVSDPAHPTWIAEHWPSFPTCWSTMVIAADVLYLAANEVEMVDVSDPAHPTTIGTIAIGQVCCTASIAAAGSRAYLGESAGLQILDISDPRSPVTLGWYQSEQPVRSVVVDGDRAFLTMGAQPDASELRLLDVSRPSAPVVLAGYAGRGADKKWPPTVTVSTDYLCFGDGGWGTTFFDRSLITGAGIGSFSPSPYVQNPTYLAPASTGGRDETIALRVRATCDGEPALTASASCTVTVKGTVTLTTSANPAQGGSVTGGGSYPYGATAAITAVPAEGWAFDGWTGPVADPEAAATTVLMDGDRSVTANFVRTWFEDDDLSISYRGTWRTLSDPLATAGHLRYSKASRASATFSFTGTGLKWHTMLGPQMGKAQVWLDGAGPLLVDLYRSTSQAATISQLDLSPGQHTIVVQVSGKKNRASKGTRVSVDAFEVLP